MGDAPSQRISLRAEALRLALRFFKTRHGRQRLPPPTVRARLKRVERFVPRPPPGTRTTVIDGSGVNSVHVAVQQARCDRCVLYFHGGAYTLGTAALLRDFTWRIGAAARACVLYFDYRLAPEHPFPAALEDAQHAYLWLREQTPDPDGIVLAGDSSGAGLVLSLLLALKRDRLALPAAAVVFCPWLALSPTSDPSATDAPLATDEDVRRCVDAYLSGHPADDPVVDPLGAELTGLPPMLIQAATGDARLADAKALAARAEAHGVDARLELFPVQAHAFQLFWSFLPEAADAMDAAGAFIRSSARHRDDMRRQHAVP